MAPHLWHQVGMSDLNRATLKILGDVVEILRKLHQVATNIVACHLTREAAHAIGLASVVG